MKKQQVIVIVCALALGLFVFRGVFSSSDEKAIERILNLVENQLEFNEPLKPLDIAGRLNSLKGLIDQDVEIEVEMEQTSKSWNGFDTVKTGALAGSRMLRSCSINRLPTDIQVNGERASAQFQVIGSGLSSSGESIRERFRTTVRLIKQNGDWMIRSVSVFRDQAN
jgi:hypothetical protein